MTKARLTRAAPGLALVLLAIVYGLEARSFVVGFVADPIGPKAFPYIIALLLAGLGAWLVAKPGTSHAEPAIPPARTLRLIACAASLAVYAFVLVPIGFLLATTLVMAALCLLLGAGLRPSLLASAAFSAGAFGLFHQLLGVRLPIGTLFEIGGG